MIIDASVGVKWLIAEDDTDRANALVGEELVVPSLFFVEVANAVWKKARRGELLIEPILPYFPNLRLITTVVDEFSFVERALALGRELDHAIYDCVYLAMAEQRQEPLITADIKLLRIVSGTGYAPLVRRL